MNLFIGEFGERLTFCRSQDKEIWVFFVELRKRKTLRQNASDSSGHERRPYNYHGVPVKTL